MDQAVLNNIADEMIVSGVCQIAEARSDEEKRAGLVRCRDAKRVKQAAGTAALIPLSLRPFYGYESDGEGKWHSAVNPNTAELWFEHGSDKCNPLSAKRLGTDALPNEVPDREDLRRLRGRFMVNGCRPQAVLDALRELGDELGWNPR